MAMFNEDLRAPLEALLFANGNPIPEARLMEILSVDQEGLYELINWYHEELSKRGGALSLLRVAGGYQLVTSPNMYPYIEKLTSIKEEKLSAPMMETLSIIAFKQPITKQEVEQIRGVRIERVLSRLMELDLIEEAGRKEVVGRPILYKTTNRFLLSFGLHDLTELPALPSREDVADAEELQLELLDQELLQEKLSGQQEETRQDEI
ncbi:SMC-Scp complex subunit ScpB [Selenomonas sp. TAMA-11512]|uniref:SMC-Scp complex subunit ScpB n=1 Tax=Selenomonas sp. TAMA-11512 TaxID=3095337 RepID=UPI00308DFF0B|nr:SMC-Scp complex subunit ScpB [Selenomonas sp. TAMA-11512]